MDGWGQPIDSLALNQLEIGRENGWATNRPGQHPHLLSSYTKSAVKNRSRVLGFASVSFFFLYSAVCSTHITSPVITGGSPTTTVSCHFDGHVAHLSRIQMDQMGANCLRVSFNNWQWPLEQQIRWNWGRICWNCCPLSPSGGFVYLNHKLQSWLGSVLVADLAEREMNGQRRPEQTLVSHSSLEGRACSNQTKQEGNLAAARDNFQGKSTANGIVLHLLKRIEPADGIRPSRYLSAYSSKNWRSQVFRRCSMNSFIRLLLPCANTIRTRLIIQLVDRKRICFSGRLWCRSIRRLATLRNYVAACFLITYSAAERRATFRFASKVAFVTWRTGGHHGSLTDFAWTMRSSMEQRPLPIVRGRLCLSMSRTILSWSGIRRRPKNFLTGSLSWRTMHSTGQTLLSLPAHSTTSGWIYFLWCAQANARHRLSRDPFSPRLVPSSAVCLPPPPPPPPTLKLNIF